VFAVAVVLVVVFGGAGHELAGPGNVVNPRRRSRRDEGNLPTPCAMRTGSTGLNCHAMTANVLAQNFGSFAESARRISDAKLNTVRRAKSWLTAGRFRRHPRTISA